MGIGLWAIGSGNGGVIGFPFNLKQKGFPYESGCSKERKGGGVSKVEQRDKGITDKGTTDKGIRFDHVGYDEMTQWRSETNIVYKVRP
jgi:hypothetical protein